ncbi:MULTISPECIES: flagellar basal body rod protein FlgB [unclassified Mesorhizobium]|jgi:flagellar basal-body rod protein FlgB|uniref:flagellar basal body rod protein FlgB n=1 Tax=unclassified Mesorhizobium TaxID=325217 RepID=UPI0008E2DE8F|nr:MULTISPECIES: flagellar basal body rod protein FlgB [unclassified Mesorhizobium]RJG44099.1 flagellar basal body rod protein FlgB [Mesorhizobium sp. DCY119]SFU05881.1 flagellar basal-body rod protein FlgB [Mesorhizobium sp. YR577]
MQPVNLFNLASQQSDWLAVRQSAIAGNIANVNTPGYGTAEIEPFEKVLDKRRVAMSATQEGHFAGGISKAAYAVRNEDGKNSVLPSENTVVLENELMKAGEVRRTFELNTAIVKAFHRMMMLTVKG